MGFAIRQTELYNIYDCRIIFCSAWPSLKLNSKIGLHTTHPPHKLLGSNISAVTGPIFMKL